MLFDALRALGTIVEPSNNFKQSSNNFTPFPLLFVAKIAIFVLNI
jgi:hypothetical protein